MLSVKELFYSYDDVDVLKNISFQVEQGKLYGLFGPNGTGKTTLFKCITKIFDIKKKGEIKINSRNIIDMNANEIAKTISYVPQEHKPPFPYLVKEVVLMGRTPHMGGTFGPKQEDIDFALNAMEMVGITDLSERLYTNLSGGQRQLVLLARAFCQDTEILLLDEPTSNLDFKNQLTIWRAVMRITKSGKAAIICSHDPNHVLWFCDEVILLGREGRVVTQGKPKEVITDERLNDIYNDVCTIKSFENRAMVLPCLEQM